eukprot:gene27427-36200_t
MQAQRDAFRTFFEATGGQRWKDKGNWEEYLQGSGCFDKLHGVAMTNQEGQGPAIDLCVDNNGLSGSIPPEIGQLMELRSINLSLNFLTGSIPPEFGRLIHLTSLDLSMNTLKEGISPEIGQLIHLTHLDLHCNSLTGFIPPEIGNLKALTYVDLGKNKLLGFIPPEIGNLEALTYLDLGGNELSGSIPPEIGQLVNLGHLFLSGNSLNGSIPSEIGNLKALSSLHLGRNQLSGSIPPEIGNLKNLSFLYLDKNKLSGSIPPEIGELTYLRHLNLEDNSIAGSIPSEIGNLKALSSLHLEKNRLSGSVPPEIGALVSLYRLNLNDNSLTDCPASVFPKLKNAVIDLRGNQLGPEYDEVIRNGFVAAAYPDLKSFLDARYEEANLIAPTFSQHKIVSQCVKRFVANGYVDTQSIVAACEDISDDVLDLRATANNIPIKLVAVIYDTILGMREPTFQLETVDEGVDFLKIPLHLVCPLSHQLFDDPVTTALGYTYERNEIEKWFAKHDTDPVTNNRVNSKELVQNRGIVSAVAEYKKKLGEQPKPAAKMSSNVETFHQDLRSFLASSYEEAGLSGDDKEEIVSSCVRCFVINGYKSMESVEAACKHISSDDLNLKAAKIPHKLITVIYNRILDMRNTVSQEDVRIATVPYHLKCPMSLKLFEDPVQTVLGRTYERKYIEKWLLVLQCATDPLSNMPLDSKSLTPDIAKREAVAELRKLQEEMIKADSYIAECIPYNIFKKLEAPDSSEDVELREKSNILSDRALLQYYVTMQVTINAVVMACAIICSDRQSDQGETFENAIASAIANYRDISWGVFGLNILKVITEKWKDNDKPKWDAVYQLKSTFYGGSNLISEVAERVAREKTMSNKSKLTVEGSKSPLEADRLGKEALRKAIEACLDQSEEVLLKDAATTDTQFIVQSLMKRDVAVGAITRAILEYQDATELDKAHPNPVLPGHSLKEPSMSSVLLQEGDLTDVKDDEPPGWVQTPLVFAYTIAKERSSTNNRNSSSINMGELPVSVSNYSFTTTQKHHVDDKEVDNQKQRPTVKASSDESSSDIQVYVSKVENPTNQPTPFASSEGIRSEMQIEPPVLRQTPFVVTRSVSNQPVEGAFIMVDKQRSSLLDIEVWQQSKSRRLIRLEYDSEKKLRQVMSANFIFTTLTDSLYSDTTGLRETIQNKVNALAGDIGETGIWIEKSASMSRLCALHFSSPKIKFFDSILQVAVEMKLQPFPNYCKLCSPRILKSGPFFDSAAWNNDSSFYGKGKPNAEDRPSRIKIGIIDPHFSQHDNLIFSNVIEEQGELVDDHNRGTHVAGIIGALKSTDNSVVMRGVCSPDNVELFAYALCSARVPNHYIGIHIVAIINALLRCSEDSVDLVDLSMQWCCQYSRDELARVINMRDAIVTEIAINNTFHVVIAAGDDSRNLEVHQIDSVINTGDPEVWVDLFSSIASCIRNRFTIVGASDIFGQLASFSNYGTTRDVGDGIVGTIVDLVAPGERILSTEYSPNGYHVRDGTFHAAPLIAGAMALIKFNSPAISFTEIASMLKATADVNFTLVGKCISGGRLNLDRALGDPENALSSEERDNAYPLRDEAFAVGFGVSNIIGNHMNSQDLLVWYASEDGKLLEKKVSCMLLFLAIDHLRAVDANEFPMLLNLESRARIRESLTMRIPVPVPQRNSGQWGQLVEAIQSLQNSLAINPPELLPPDNRVTATRREWEAIFRLTMEGTIRTAFLRDWIRKKQEPTGVMQELIFVEALKVSSTAIAAIQALNLQSQQFLQMWRNEEKYIFDAMSAKAFYVRCERVKIFVAGLSIRDLLDWYYSDHGQAFVRKLSCMFWAQAIDLLRAVDEEEFNVYSKNNRSALLQGLEDAIPEPPPEIADFSDLKDTFQVHANNFLARTATPLERFPPSIDWMTATRRKWIDTLRHTKAGNLPTAFLIECAEIRQADIRQETRNLRLNRDIVVTGVQKQSLVDMYDDYDILFQCALHETAVAINFYQQHPADGSSSSFLSLWLRWENWLTIQLEEVSEMREWLSDINTVV